MFGKYNLSFGILFLFILCLIGCERIKNPLIVSPEFFAEPQWAMYGGNVRHTGNVNTPAYEGIVGPTDSTKVGIRWAINIRELTGGGVPEAHPVAGSDGTVYVTTLNGLVALNSDGTVKWVFGVYGNSPVALGDDETIYYHGGTGYLYALNPDASIKWQTLTFEYDLSSQWLNSTWMNIVVLSDNKVALTGRDSLGQKIVCLNGHNGKILWQKHFEEVMSTQIEGVSDENMMLIRNSDHSNYFIYLDSQGLTRWSIPASGGSGCVHTCIDYQGNIYADYILSSKGNIVSGKMFGGLIAMWYDRYFTTTPRYSSDSLYCYDLKKEKIIWRKKQMYGSLSNPTVDSKGNVFVLNSAGHFYGFDKEGNIKIDLFGGNSFPFRKLLDPVLTPDGSVVVTGYWDPKVVAIK